MGGLANLTAAFKGHLYSNVAEAIGEHANRMRLTLNVVRPSQGLNANVDVNPRRLNVYLDKNARIARFNIC